MNAGPNCCRWGLNENLLHAPSRVMLVASSAGSRASLGSPRLGGCVRLRLLSPGTQPEAHQPDALIKPSETRFPSLPQSSCFVRVKAAGNTGQDGGSDAGRWAQGSQAGKGKKRFPPPVSLQPGLDPLPLTCPGASNKGGITGLKCHTMQKGSIS